MKNTSEIFSRWLDVTSGERNNIVFERLNQSYGAYEIRKNYDTALLKAFSATGLLIILFSFLCFITKAIPEDKVIIPFCPVAPINPPITIEETVIPKPEILTHPSSSSTDDLKPEVIDDEILDDHIIPKNSDNIFLGTGNPLDSGSGSDIIASNPGLAAIEMDTTTYTPFGIQEMPHFPGGDENLSPYLKNKTHIPQEIIELGSLSEKVGIVFVVDKDGSVINAAILKKGSRYFQLNKEALRVIQQMPKWEPGRQNGKPVKVQMVLPIRFEVK